jgi:3-hydroxyacyl-[acyl-carrier-protein] dehydratase
VATDAEILRLIPHRPPFLWVDKIISFDRKQQEITTSTCLPNNLALCQGHYPGNPIIPGVILNEAIFQTGALLIAKLATICNNLPTDIPVLTRIKAAKFKKIVIPGDLITMQVNLIETIGAAWYLKGQLRVNKQVAVKVQFTCALTTSSEITANG